MMKKLPALVFAVAACLARADSVVVFNEIMYHSQTNEPASEWVELHNQMAVDIELTGWSLRGGTRFDFPAGTVLAGGGYLVVASAPTNSIFAGRTNVLGPLIGRLANSGDTLELRNNNDRLMDELEYGVEGEWPVAPDGAGTSLAKIDEGSASGTPANWRSSTQIGGTPGLANRLRINGTNIPPQFTLAINELSSVTNAQFSAELVNFGTQAVALTDFVLYRFGTTNREYVLPAQTLPARSFVVLDRALLGFGADPGDQVILYAPGKTNVIDAVVAKSYPRARLADGVGAWMRSTVPTFGASNVVTLQDDIVINEILYQPRPLAATPAVYATNILLTITNQWRYDSRGIDLGSEWISPNYDDSAWPVGRAVFYTNVNTLPAPRGTTLNLSNAAQQAIVAYYFRTEFEFTNSLVGLQLLMNPIIDDGAVFYLNGVEVYRYGMANPSPTHTTLASTNIGVPTYSGPVTIPTEALVDGINVLAVEVHQYLPPPGSRDVAFAADLAAVRLLSPALPERDSPESWIELYNRGLSSVDVSGWQLDEGITFTFPSNTIVPPDGYLVVARDVGYMQTNFPSVTAVGPFSGRLSHGDDRLLLLDRVGNPADEVHYCDDMPWPTYAGGLGASLELRDPRADNSRPEAWAASDQSAASEWQTYTYRGIAMSEPAPSPAQWNEFVLGLLGEGEVLLDDISVIENPSGARRQLIQHGSFQSTTVPWRFLGNHERTQVITDPTNPGNRVLRLVTTGDTGHMHNHAETTFTNNSTILNGTEYEISFKAKWIAGCEKLNTRLYFNRLARTTRLTVPAMHGTPGARNSTYVSNTGPTFSSLSHFPIAPTSGQSVRVTVVSSDPDSVASAALHYSVNGGSWQSNVMAAVNSSTGVVFTATVPPQPSSALVQFYARALDGTGAAANYPPAGTNSRALYRVSDGTALPARLHSIRLLMTAADAAILHSPTNVMSNHRMPCTIVYDDREVIYNAGVHLQGSERGRNVSARVGFSVKLPADRLFRGRQDSFTIDRSGGYTSVNSGLKHDEILLKHAVNRSGGLPGMYDDIVQAYTPRSSENGTGLLIMAKYGSEFLDTQYEDGNDGEMYKLELIYYPTTTTTGDPQAPKLPQPDNVVGTDIRDLGVDKEAYRWHFLKENHVSRDHYQELITLAEVMSLTGTNFSSRISEIMDVDEWMRAVAFLSLIGANDMYTYDNHHNLIIYIRPEDKKAMAFLWDMDYAFAAPTTRAFPGSGSATTYKLITTIPDNYRRYYNHLYDLSGVTGDSAYMGQWANRYAGLLGQSWAAQVNYLQQRATYVRSTMPLNTPLAITVNGGTNYTVSTNTTVLSGTAPMAVRDIEINGIRYPITWTSLTNWTTAVSLPASTNLLVIKGVNNAGGYVTNPATSITITNQSVPALAPVVINEWMADNAGPGGFPDPLDNQFQDWFELFNPNDASFDLSGYLLTDNLAQPNKWVIPTNTVVPAKGFLLVWADEDGLQNTPGNDDLHANFKLSTGGEALGLFSPNGTRLHAVSFFAQQQNVSQGLFPDGNTNSIHFLTNWTPRAANQLGGLNAPQFAASATINGTNVILTAATLPNRAYRVDYKEQLDSATWIPLSTNRSSASQISVTDGMTRPQRFYRLVLLP